MDEFKKLELNYTKFWSNEKALYIMPHTNRGKLYLSKITKDIFIKGILDNNEDLEGENYNQIPIYYAKNFLNKDNRCKILISNHYTEISEQLNQLGYIENIDYIDLHKYVSFWYWQNKREIHILDMHIAITTNCSLNCRNCNMFINFYEHKERKNISCEEFKENIDNLFKNIDYCYRFTIVGGEPFLNVHLGKMLNWLGEKYQNNIGIIEVVTNGTIIPNDELFQVFKQHNVRIAISNYGKNVFKMQKIDILSKRLEEKGVSYEEKREMKWKDFYFPRAEQHLRFDNIREHMLNCNPIFRGINNNKFYYCHLVWSAVEAKLLLENENDFISINKKMKEEERKELLAFDLGYMKNGYISLCKKCGGCGKDNETIIEAGIQDN